jgi:hypothetical protein
MKSTRKLLACVPLDDGHRGYKPHDKSMSLDRLATHVAELPACPELALATEAWELKEEFKPALRLQRRNCWRFSTGALQKDGKAFGARRTRT